jgi:hypothetical protein
MRFCFVTPATKTCPRGPGCPPQEASIFRDLSGRLNRAWPAGPTLPCCRIRLPASLPHADCTHGGVLAQPDHSSKKRGMPQPEQGEKCGGSDSRSLPPGHLHRDRSFRAARTPASRGRSLSSDAFAPPDPAPARQTRPQASRPAEEPIHATPGPAASRLHKITPHRRTMHSQLGEKCLLGEFYIGA